MSEPTPTPEQEQRAKWDLLLLDVEMRSEQLRQLKTHGSHLVLLDIELRTQQVIHMKRFATWKAIAGFATAVAAVAGVIVGLAHLLH